MKKEFTETSLLRKSFSKPQFTVVKLAGADIISTSGQLNAPFAIKAGQGYDEEDW